MLDVGAHTGEFATELRGVVGFDGNVVSFEPDPFSFRTLEAAAALVDNWAAHPMAIGASDGTAVLHRYTSSDWNSLNEIDVVELERSGRSIESLPSVDCEVRSIDSIWDELGLGSARIGLKSDTQGHDLDVVRGAAEHLDQVDVLVLEAAVHPLYAGEPDVGEVLAVAGSFGFRPTGFFPVTRARGGLALESVDVCFVRPD